VRRSIRDALSAVVGLGVMALTVAVDAGSLSLVAMSPLVYAPAEAFALDEGQTVRSGSGADTSRKVGILGEGIDAGSTVGPFQQSFAAGIAGQGAFAFDIALVTAAVGAQTGEQLPAVTDCIECESTLSNEGFNRAVQWTTVREVLTNASKPVYRLVDVALQGRLQRLTGDCVSLAVPVAPEAAAAFEWVGPFTRDCGVFSRRCASSTRA
jgi:hypothetical protein